MSVKPVCVCLGYLSVSPIALAIHAGAMKLIPKSAAYTGSVYTSMWASMFSSLNLKPMQFINDHV